MLLPGAEQLGMNHNQCLELLEGVEDTLNFLTSTLTYLIHTESKKPEPDIALLTELEALDQEVFDVGYALAGSDVSVYQQVLEKYRQRTRELRPLVDQLRKADMTS